MQRAKTKLIILPLICVFLLSSCQNTSTDKLKTTTTPNKAISTTTEENGKNTTPENSIKQDYADLEAVDVNGQTALISAAASGNKELVKRLLELGANPNAQANEGYTALMVIDATNYTAIDTPNYIEIADMLLYFGADINIKEKMEGGNVLNYISTTPEIVQYLIDHGAEINSTTYDGYTPLMSAVREKDIEMIRVLIKNKANTDLKNSYGESAIDLAENDEEVLKALNCSAAC